MKKKTFLSILLGILMIFGWVCSANATPYSTGWTGSVTLDANNTSAS